MNKLITKLYLALLLLHPYYVQAIEVAPLLVSTLHL